MALLDDEQIGKHLQDLEGWRRDQQRIYKHYTHEDFVGSVQFVNALVEPAEDMNHHPDLEISWDTVTVSITNHSEGGLTEADFELARRIDGLGSGLTDVGRGSEENQPPAA